MKEWEEERKTLYGYGENRRITDGDFDASLAVKCVNGTFVGRKTDNIIAYKGIPFVGRQPVGELRWKAPVEFTADDGVYEAFYNGKSACQNKFYGEDDDLYNQGEDCLYLDIWKADDAPAEKKPVLVWVHGGAFEAGGTASPLFECHNIVKENPEIIVVSIAYRLGVFGFFHLSHLPGGEEYPDAQNLGLMDQMMALKWVHENIAGFGGDPESVTIGGESAGAGSVTLLPLIEGSHAYFNRVLSESGFPSFTRSSRQAIECTDELMAKLGCETLDDLRKLDADTLVEASRVISLRVSPERDGNYLPLDPYGAYAKGVAKDINFLMGCMKNEFDYFPLIMGEEAFARWAEDLKKEKLARLTDEERDLVLSYCRDAGADPCAQVCRLLEQSWFNAPLIRLAENQTMAGGRVFTYFFTAEPGHGEELVAVFDHQELNGEEGRVYDETFAKTMRKMWVQFIRTGDPSLSAEMSADGKAKTWPLYDLCSKQIMIFDEFDIHPEKVEDRKIVDWDRTYFLTKYFWL